MRYTPIRIAAIAALLLTSVLAGVLTTQSTEAARASYFYHGCRVYTPHDWFTTDLLRGGSRYASNSVDPESRSYIDNMNRALPNLSFNYARSARAVAELEIVNLATNATPMHTLSRGIMHDDPWHDDPDNRIPWQDGFRSEGTAGCRFDCHTIVLNVERCLDYETYQYGEPSWNGSSFAATRDGGVKNLHHPYHEQQIGHIATAAGTPLLGTTDFGEDLQQAQIHHIIGFYWGGAFGTATGGAYVAPANASVQCTSHCRKALPFGARLRLHARYPCPPAKTNPQANKVCAQLKIYGMMLTDSSNMPPANSYGYAGLRLGLNADGSNPWNDGDMSSLLDRVRITDFDVMKLGTIH